MTHNYKGSAQHQLEDSGRDFKGGALRLVIGKVYVAPFDQPWCMLADTTRDRFVLEAIRRHVRRVQQRFRHTHVLNPIAALVAQQLTN
jgi:hypothetical protein